MIVVAGAGIAGLAAAIALADQGDVLILERRGEGEASAGAGIQLSPNAMHALAALGAADAVAARAAAPTGLAIAAAGRSTPIARIDYAALAARYGAPYLTIARADLYEALLEVAHARSSIEIRYGAAFESTARQTHAGLAGNPALLVGADGVHSALRRASVGDEPNATELLAWRARSHTDVRRDPPHEDGSAQAVPSAGERDTRLTLARGRHLVRYALSARNDCGHGARNSRASDRTPTGSPNAQEETPSQASDARGDNLVLVTDARVANPSAMGGPLASLIVDAGEWTPWPIRVRRSHVFQAGPVAFVGDASHAMLPFLAQGGAMALEDAAVLSAAVRAHGLCEGALAAYATARRDRVARIASLSRRQGLIYHLAPPLSLARDALLGRLGSDLVRARLDFIYRWRPPSEAA